MEVLEGVLFDGRYDDMVDAQCLSGGDGHVIILSIPDGTSRVSLFLLRRVLSSCCFLLSCHCHLIFVVWCFMGSWMTSIVWFRYRASFLFVLRRMLFVLLVMSSSSGKLHMETLVSFDAITLQHFLPFPFFFSAVHSNFSARSALLLVDFCVFSIEVSLVNSSINEQTLPLERPRRQWNSRSGIIVRLIRLEEQVAKDDLTARSATEFRAAQYNSSSVSVEVQLESWKIE